MVQNITYDYIYIYIRFFSYEFFSIVLFHFILKLIGFLVMYFNIFVTLRILCMGIALMIFDLKWGIIMPNA